MLQELASRSAPQQEKKPLTDTDFIRLAQKRYYDLVRQTSPSQPDEVNGAVHLLYDIHARSHTDMDPQVKAKLRERTWNVRMFDLGAGDGVEPETIKYFGFKPYIGVDLRAVPISRYMRVNSDALTFLFKQPNGYGNVMANGFFCEHWFPSEMEGYVDHAFQHIRRILPKNGVFIATHFEFIEEAERAGLAINPELSKVRNNVLVFERGLLPPRK